MAGADRIAEAMTAFVSNTRSFVDLLSEFMNGLLDADSVGIRRKLLHVAERRISVFALGFLDRYRVLPMPFQKLPCPIAFGVSPSDQ